MVTSSITTPGMVPFLSLRNFVYSNLLQYTQLQMSTNIVEKILAMNWCPVQKGQYNCTLSCLLYGNQQVIEAFKTDCLGDDFTFLIYVPTIVHCPVSSHRSHWYLNKVMIRRHSIVT